MDDLPPRFETAESEATWAAQKIHHPQSSIGTIMVRPKLKDHMPDMVQVFEAG